jgi:16S rRNA (adenine1518-N6/adenine1519-N6)-dimethyltransferase
VLCQVAYRVNVEMEIKPGSFYPAPEVSSSVISLDRQEDIRQPRERDLFQRLVRASFLSRRKTIWNNLLAGGFVSRYGADALRAALTAEGIEPGRRGETLEPERFVTLADRLAGGA